MSDILSGGAIDESTSGPIPPKVDDRQRDVLEEQRIRQEQEAIGGTQFPPTTEPPPFIPEPPQIAPPPLPDIDIPSLGIDFGGAAEVTREIARQTAIDVLKRVTIDGQTPIIEGSSISFNTSRRSVASEDFIAVATTNLAQPPTIQGQVGMANLGAEQTSLAMQIASGFSEAEARSSERRASDPSFDRESSIRQRGETPREFQERQAQLRSERAQEARQERLIQRAREGDISEVPSGYIPVALNRADGQKRVLALVATELVGVVDGAVSGERVAGLPSEDSYYEAGGGAVPPHPWQITIENKSTGTTPNWQYKIEPASRLFNGFGGNSITVNGADGVFRNIETGYYILEISFSENGTVEQAQIEISSNFGNAVETSGSPLKQTKARIRIGFVFLEGGNYIVRQNAFHNFSLVDACRNGVPIKFPIAT
jgi:hypothetical protein